MKRKGFDPKQPRDPDGRWTVTGALAHLTTAQIHIDSGNTAAARAALSRARKSLRPGDAAHVLIKSAQQSKDARHMSENTRVAKLMLLRKQPDQQIKEAKGSKWRLNDHVAGIGKIVKVRGNGPSQRVWARLDRTGKVVELHNVTPQRKPRAMKERTTRQQDEAVDKLSLKHGRLLVRTGYEDKFIRVTAPSGAHYIIDEEGRIQTRGTDFSVNWNQ
jgi:hypothetical protein